MSRQLELPGSRVWDDDYWLTRCEGFSVDGPSGHLGVVSEEHFRSRLDGPDELVVRGGLLGSRLTVVAVSEVAEVLPDPERIVLSVSHDRRPHKRFARLHKDLSATPGSG